MTRMPTLLCMTLLLGACARQPAPVAAVPTPRPAADPPRRRELLLLQREGAERHGRAPTGKATAWVCPHTAISAR